MKYCPTCKQAYEDDGASFCSKDATPLVGALSSSVLPETMFPVPPQEAATLSPGTKNLGAQSGSSITLEDQPRVQASNAAENGNGGAQSSAQSESDSSGAAPVRLVFDLSSEPAAPAKADVRPQPKAQARPAVKARPRRRRLLLMAGAVVMLLIVVTPVAAFLWWRNYKTTPSYSLAVMVDALHRNDTATFDQRLAAEKVADASASQIKENMMSQYTSEVSESTRKQADQKLTALLPNIKQVVRDDVDRQFKEDAETTAGESFLMLALGMPSKVEIKQDGDTATVTTKGHPAELTMQRTPEDLWTIVAVKDDAMSARITSQFAKELPASVDAKKSSASVRNSSQAQAEKPPVNVAVAKKPDNPRTRKKGRKTQPDGITIELRRLPFPP